MSKTLLDAVNEVGKRCGFIDSYNIGLLTSLTQSNIQRDVDLTIQLVNEGIDELVRGKDQSPITMGTNSITLATGTREYNLATDLITLFWPLRDTTNTQFIIEFPGSFLDLLQYDPDQSFTGLPLYGIISPETGKFRVEIAPDSSSNGRVYNYDYKKNLVLTLSTDAMPFNDEVFRAMVPAWAQMWRRERNKEFDQALYQQAMGRAAYAIRETPPRSDYSPRGTTIFAETSISGI